MLYLHRAERADRLVAALAELLADPAGGDMDPRSAESRSRSRAAERRHAGDIFVPELVAVHSRGIERWLAQELSGRLGSSAARSDGVCANVEFPFPRALVRDAAEMTLEAVERSYRFSVHLVDPEQRPADEAVDAFIHLQVDSLIAVKTSVVGYVKRKKADIG
jgi:hypothetical protein